MPGEAKIVHSMDRLTRNLDDLPIVFPPCAE
jgi:hypothetical protein